MKFPGWVALSMGVMLFAYPVTVSGSVISFYNSSQTTSVGTSGATYNTLISEGYQFQSTADKFWSPAPGGTPTGRFFSVFWPDGIHAQAVTAGPNIGSAMFTITRVDKDVFDINHITFKLLANTGGAGAAIEIMPLLAGEDAFPNPLALDATGYGGQTFNYNTPTLAGFDTYKISLYVDFAITGLTITDATVPEPSIMNSIAIFGILFKRRRIA